MHWFKGKRIIVPFDYSDESMEAVKVAVTLADSRSEVHVVHVLVELPATEPMVIWDEFSEEKRRSKTRESMEEKLSAENMEGVQIDVGLGNPATVIADLAAETEAAMIVIPSHGYTGLKRFMLGSVAERVVRLAKCPVLVLKKHDQLGLNS